MTALDHACTNSGCEGHEKSDPVQSIGFLRALHTWHDEDLHLPQEHWTVPHLVHL